MSNVAVEFEVDKDPIVTHIAVEFTDHALIKYQVDVPDDEALTLGEFKEMQLTEHVPEVSSKDHQKYAMYWLDDDKELDQTDNVSDTISKEIAGDSDKLIIKKK